LTVTAEGEVFVIEFHCKNCGQKIVVKEIHAGRKGKCPKCKNIVVVPRIIPAGPSKPQNNLQDANIDSHSSAPGFQPFLSAPADNVPDISTNPSYGPDQRPEAIPETPYQSKTTEPDQTGKRPLPWLIDIFLYPVSTPGLTNLAIIIAVPLLLQLAVKALGPFAMALAIPALIIRIVIGLYAYWYICQCIRDSALGGVRAPETLANNPGLSDMFSETLNILACYVIFACPAGLYYLYVGKTDAIFWALLVYGVFFFPMGLLAVVMFNSSAGFSPWLWLGSIFSTFLPYCVLVAVIIGLVALAIIVLPQLLPLMFLPNIIVPYSFLVLANLLGRFYWRYQEKLYWEV